MASNPNPFYFVPFHLSNEENPESPLPLVLRPEEWAARFGDPITGYAEFRLTALQPLHVAGVQDPGDAPGKKTGYSHFHRQGDVPVLPGSLIKGMARSFIEALTCGHLTHATETYKKEFKKRHIGFSPFKDVTNPHGNGTKPRTRPPAVPAEALLQESALQANRVDLAHFLFGYVHGSQHHAGRLVFDDVEVPIGQLGDQFHMVDLLGTALMGGAKPCASNWWYFHPDEVFKRQPTGVPHAIAEPLGKTLRGRKFYFHQDAVKCVDWYMNTANGWHKPGTKTELYRYPVESLRPGGEVTFRLGFHDVPKQLVNLLVRVLDTGMDIRHKLGLGKAFGFGSCAFTLQDLAWRPSRSGFGPMGGKREFIHPSLTHLAYDPDHEEFIDLFSIDLLDRLNKILAYQTDILFTYPRFGPGGGGFAQPVKWDDDWGQDTARATSEIIRQISNGRPATDLDFYQKSSVSWNRIENRRLQDPYAS